MPEANLAPSSVLSGRWGGSGSGAKLTLSDVREIRAWYDRHPQLTVSAVARELVSRYRVSRSALGDVLRGASWPDPSWRPVARFEPVATPVPSGIRYVVPCPANNAALRRNAEKQIAAIESYLGRKPKSAVTSAAMLLLLLLPALASAQTGKSESCEKATPNQLTASAKTGEKFAVGFCGAQVDYAEPVLRDAGKPDPRLEARFIRDETAAANGLFFYATKLIDFPAGKHSLTIDYVKLAPNGDVVVTPMPAPLVLTVDAVTPPAPIDCVVSGWSEWSAWSVWVATSPISEQRTQTRSRTVVTDAANGGSACPLLAETATESRAITVPPPLCSAADIPSVFVTRWTSSGTGRPGSQMFVSYQMSSLTPIVQVQVKVDGAIVRTTPDSPGADYTPFGSMWFNTPASGTHALSVRVKNFTGCSREATSPTPLRVK